MEAGLECRSDHILKKTCAISQKFLEIGEAKSVRCDDLDSLQKRNCPASHIENPRGSVTVNTNKPVTNRKKDEPKKLKPEEITQIQPQKLTLTLRSGSYLDSHYVFSFACCGNLCFVLFYVESFSLLRRAPDV